MTTFASTRRYWSARAELEYDEVVYARNVMRRWLRRWLREGVESSRSTIWRVIPPEELRAALAGNPPPRRKR